MKIISTINQDTNRLKQWRRSALMLALLTLLYSFFPVALAAPGDVDQTFVGFSSDGIVTASSLNGRAWSSSRMARW